MKVWALFFACLYINIYGQHDTSKWYNIDKGLPQSSAKAIVKDKYGYTRFSTENGIVRHGGSSFSSQPNAYFINSGESIFPSTNGSVSSDPDSIRTYYPEKRNIYLERVRIGNSETQYFHQMLDLNNDYKTAEVFIDIPYLSNPKNLYIEAKISGKENSEWEPIATGKELKYTISNLSPGEYSLSVRVLVSPDGKFEEKTVRFRIHPLFYHTLLFRVSLSVIILIVIIVIVQLMTNFLRIKNKALKQIVHNKNSELKETSLTLESIKSDLQRETEYQKKLVETISHDITTPIRFIAMLSQKLYESDDAELQKKYFDSIYKSSEQLYQFTLNLKEYTELYKAENITEEHEYPINRILEIKKRLFCEIAKERGTTIVNTTENKVYTKVNESILTAVIHNILDNAVKNTIEGEIILNVTENNQKSTITISDTGIGMSSDQIADYIKLFKNPKLETPSFKGKGLGLHMVIHLVKKMNAEMSFRQNHPKGTVVEIILYKN